MLDETRAIKTAPEPLENRSAWYLLTGLVIGLALGLIYTWLINPVVYVNTEPASLEAPYKEFYRLTIAQVYSATGNFDRAYKRLALLEDKDPVLALGAQAQSALADGDIEDARALALLASALSETKINQNGINHSIPAPIPTATIEAVPTQTLPHPSPTP